MKKIVLNLILLMIIANISNAQKGVNFVVGGNLRTVFDLAKMQNKAVFLEAYAPTCHVCIAFKPTFELPLVGDFYNRNYISYKLDVTTTEAQAFLQKQKIWIPSTPTLLFFDKEVKLLHIAVMGENTNTAQVVIDAAGKALDPKRRSTAYKASFQSGVRDPNFLIDYAFMARIMKDTTDNIAAMKAYASKTPSSQYTNNSNFLVLQKVIMDDENPIFTYMMTHLAEYNAKYDKALVKQTAENIIMYSLYSSRGSRSSVAKINQVKANLTKLGIDKKSIAGRVFREETTALFREGKPDQAIKVLESLIDSRTDKNAYLFLSNFVRARTADKNALAKAATWAAKAK
jgi:thiol-disulfide isomerase/thioredoxin